MSALAHKIEGGDYERGGAAARHVKEQLKQVGADPAVIRRAMVAAYEAEMNVVIHAHRGELRATLDNGQLDVEVIDEGPGIPDVERALKPGFSTASAKARELGFGAGMGLPNIKKNSDLFSIESVVGRGTTIRFSVLLKSQALYGVGRNSIHVQADRCQESFHCLHACPTQAVRVFRGKPQVLDYRCIDCTACISACPSGALRMVGQPTADTAARLPDAGEGVLVLPPASLVQFGPGIDASRVLAELAALGWTDVRTTDAWDAALREACIHYAVDSGQRPVISPACPAVVNLIEIRYPSLLPNVAPFLSALEAARADCGVKPAVCVICCPSQRTALLANGAAPTPTLATPTAVTNTVAPRLAHAGAGATATRSGGLPGVEPSPQVLHVTGIRHVTSVLEAIENGLADDVAVIEPWACDGGCFGSPLLTEDPSLSRRRWDEAPAKASAGARAQPRPTPLAPRPGLRLDDDMSKAIQKLAKIDKLTRSLPGSNCAVCGAPTCAALAEDIVLGRTTADACPRRPAGGPDAPPTEQENSR